MIFYIMGKSASGKDSIYKSLLLKDLNLKKVPIWTTRPKRDGETDGMEYYFVSKDFLDNNDKIIEKRIYHTVFGDWYYATIDDGYIKKDEDYLMIGTLASYMSMKEYFGENNLFPIYIEIDNATRLERAKKREMQQNVPKLEEMERRFLADEIDFSEENVKKAKINKKYENIILENCIEEIVNDIKKVKNNV